MKLLTHEEIKAMVGTEYIAVTSTRTEYKAFIAAFDPDIGFTCLAASLIDSKGNDHSDETDKNGNLCLTFLDAEIHKMSFSHDISFMIRSIKCLGYYKVYSEDGFRSCGGGAGQPTCGF